MNILAFIMAVFVAVSNQTVPIDIDTNPFIIDLDFCTDVDDAVAVRMATSLDKQGMIDLKASMLCTTGSNNITAMNGILNYDGYGHIPIGSAALDEPDSSPYWDLCSEYALPEDQIQTKNSVTLYREILSSSLNPVTIVTTGYVTNIAELLKSEPDEISNLDGKELVKRKVKAIYITGGSYPDGYCNNFFFTENARKSVNYILEHCEAPMYFISSNNGAPINCGGLLQARDVNRIDPVSRSLDAFGTSVGRAAWDPMSVWVAALPLEKSNMMVERANLVVDLDTGFNTFTACDDGKIFRMNRVHDDLNWYKVQLDEMVVKGTPFDSIYYIDNK